MKAALAATSLLALFACSAPRVVYQGGIPVNASPPMTATRLDMLFFASSLIAEGTVSGKAGAFDNPRQQVAAWKISISRVYRDALPHYDDDVLIPFGYREAGIAPAGLAGSQSTIFVLDPTVALEPPHDGSRGTLLRLQSQVDIGLNRTFLFFLQRATLSELPLYQITNVSVGAIPLHNGRVAIPMMHASHGWGTGAAATFTSSVAGLTPEDLMRKVRADVRVPLNASSLTVIRKLRGQGRLSEDTYVTELILCPHLLPNWFASVGKPSASQPCVLHGPVPL